MAHWGGKEAWADHKWWPVTVCAPLSGVASYRSLILVLRASDQCSGSVHATQCHLPQGLVRLHCSHRWHLQHTRAEMLKIVGPTASGQASWKCLTSWTDGQEPPAPYWRWLCSWSGDAQGYRSGLGLSPGHWASHSQGHRLSACP